MWSSPTVDLLCQSSECWKGPPSNAGNQPGVVFTVAGTWLVLLDAREVTTTALQNLREDPLARNLDLSSYLLVPSMFPVLDEMVRILLADVLVPTRSLQRISQCSALLDIPYSFGRSCIIRI